MYNDLSEEKMAHLRGEKGDRLVPESELDEIVERETKNAAREACDEIIRSLINDAGFGPSKIADGFPISQQRIGQIARED